MAMKTLEQYFRDDAARGVFDHAARCIMKDGGRVTFYIHPCNVDGETPTFEAHGNICAQDRDVLYPGDPGHPDTVAPAEPAAPRPHLREDGWPTRASTEHWTPAEHAVAAAMHAVEAAGGSVALTDAICLLSQARGRIADHAEGRA